MNPQDQAELDALMQQPKYTMHGQWHKSPDVVECVKLANMLHSEFVIREDIAFILMLSSVITCPSMTSLFRDLLKSALLQQLNTDDPRDAALDIMAQFHERGLPAIAKQEIEAFVPTPEIWKHSAFHLDHGVHLLRRSIAFHVRLSWLGEAYRCAVSAGVRRRHLLFKYTRID